MKHITFHLDFISPYAYLAFAQLPEALKGISYGVDYRPVLFAGMLKHHVHETREQAMQAAGLQRLTRLARKDMAADDGVQGLCLNAMRAQGEIHFRPGRSGGEV